MLQTITQTIQRNVLGVSVSLLLVASVVVPSAMLAQQATPEESTATFEVSKATEETPPTQEPPTGGGGGETNPSVCVPDARGDLRAPDGSPFDPYTNSRVVINGSTASITVKNFSTDCTYPIHMASYKVFDQWGTPEFISTQILHRDTANSIAPGETKTISVQIFGTCQYQVDFFEGPSAPQTNPDFAQLPAYTLFDWGAGFAPLPLCGTPPPPPTCVPNPDADLRAPDGSSFDPYNNSRVVINGSTASIAVKNFSESCAYNVHLVSYNVFDQWGTPEFISTQTLFDDTTVSIPSGQTRTLSVTLPSCAYQVDLFEGPNVPQTNPDFGHEPLLSSHTLFDWAARLTPLCGQSNPGFLRVIKTVINNEGGTKQVSDFNLYVDSTQVVSGATNQFTLGAHTVREDQLPGYTAGMWGGDCTPNGVVTLVAGQTKTCTITNSDNPVPPNPAYIKIIKTVINDDGGIKQISDFKLYVNSALVVSGATNQFPAGAYTVREDQLPGYTAGVWGGDCAANGVVTLVAGQTKTCTIVNNDNPVSNRATLTIIKTVINDNGGTKQVADFHLFADNIPFVSGIAQHLQPGTRTVHEDQLPGYTASVWGGDCAANGTVTLLAGDNKTCTITNNDNPIISNPASLTVIKTVINDNGGTKQVSDFNLFVERVGSEAPTVQVKSGETNQFAPAAYLVFEDQLPGYTASVWGGDCAANGTVTLVAGQSKTCTITNNDNPIISNPATLTVIKTVINDNGGTKQVSDFSLYVQRTDSKQPPVLVKSGEANKFNPGPFNVFEVNLPGYTATVWGGDCSSDGNVTLLAGDNKTCTITNNDNPGGGGDDDDDDDDDDGGGHNGGGNRRPKVVLFSTPEVLGSSISLTQVPYTGLGSSLLQIFLFILGLLAISGGVTYAIARRRTIESITVVSSPQATEQRFSATQASFEETVPEVDTLSAYDEYTSRVQPAPMYSSSEHIVEKEFVSEAPVDLPIAPAVPVAEVVAQSRVTQMVAEHKQAVAQNTVSLARLQDVARASQTLVSDDGMKLVINSTEGDEKKALERLSQVIDIAKTRYPREDGWLVLDKSRVRESLFVSTLSMVPLFVEWMVRAEDKHLFGFLRMLKSQEQPVADFMRKVVAELDNAHRARLEGAEEKTTVNAHIAEVTYHLSNTELEMIIGELLRGVDERYESAYTSVRLALVRVLDVIKERQFTRIGGAYSFSQSQEA